MSLVRFNEEQFPTSFSSMLDRFFDENVKQRNERFLPKVDVSEDEKSFGIHVSVPGMKKEDFKINVENNQLVISGERTFKHEEKDDKKFHRIETEYGSFSRSFSLPETADAEKIEASYEDGILEVSIPKDEKKAAVKSIAVK